MRQLIPGNVKVDTSTGYVYSTCGTKLGSLFTDADGERCGEAYQACLPCLMCMHCLSVCLSVSVATASI